MDCFFNWLWKKWKIFCSFPSSHIFIFFRPNYNLLNSLYFFYFRIIKSIILMVKNLIICISTTLSLFFFSIFAYLLSSRKYCHDYERATKFTCYLKSHMWMDRDTPPYLLLQVVHHLDVIIRSSICIIRKTIAIPPLFGHS